MEIGWGHGTDVVVGGGRGDEVRAGFAEAELAGAAGSVVVRRHGVDEAVFLDVDGLLK